PRLVPALSAADGAAGGGSASPKSRGASRGLQRYGRQPSEIAGAGTGGAAAPAKARMKAAPIREVAGGMTWRVEMGPQANLRSYLPGDSGALPNGVCFVLGQAFDSLFLLPPALHELTREGLPVPAHPYESVHDILATVDRVAPDLVLLFCGYLYANN